MKLELRFQENDRNFKLGFKDTYELTDGGFDRGYEQGHKVGYDDGHTAGYEEGHTKGYNEGRDSGYEEGHTEGTEQGRKAEYDEFWDAYQENGAKTYYRVGFGGRGWTPQIFRPKYDMKPTDAYWMFNAANNLKLDLVEHLDSLGVSLDFSSCTNAQQIFSNCGFSRVGVVDLRSVPSDTEASCSAIFAWNGALKTIDKLILKEDGSLAISAWFSGTSNLEDLTLEGKIGRKGFSVSSCTKLTKASIISIINALLPTASALTVTLSKTAVNKAFATAQGGSNGSTSAEWAALIATKPTWTISLV